MRGKIAAKAERGLDFYPSPPQAAWGLVAAEGALLPRNLWECACGDGALVRPLRASGRRVVATDLVDRGCEDAIARVDFLLELAAPEGVAGVVTNPPYGRLPDQFARRALELVNYAAFLLPLYRLAGGERRAFYADNLARVHVFSDRLPMMHRDGFDGPKATQQTDFAWFVFDRRPGAPRALSWVGPDELAAGQALCGGAS